LQACAIAIITRWRMIDSDVTDFPQHDSPTFPNVSPGARSKLTPSMARIVAVPERNSTARSRTRS